MMRWQKIERDARDAVVAARFQGGPAPVNPWRKNTSSHAVWNMAARRAAEAADQIQRIGA